MTDSQPNRPTSSRRRWFQFRLRTLLWMMFLCAAMLGLYVEPYRRQQRTIDRITSLKGAIVTEAVGPAWLGTLTGGNFFINVATVNLNGRRVDPALVAELASLQGLRELQLAGSGITDQALPGIGRLEQLQILSLSENPITDEGLSQLRSLELDNTPIGDAGVRHLHSLGSLTNLSLRGTNTTDAGLKDLVGLQGIEYLFLDRTRITVDSLSKLKRFPKLRWLTTTNTPILPPAIWHAMPRVSDPRLARALADPTSIAWGQAPLTDVLDYLMDLHQIPIQFDVRALRESGISRYVPVTFNYTGKLAGGLGRMLGPLGLRVSKGYDMLVIEPRGKTWSGYPALIVREPISAGLSGALHTPVRIQLSRLPLPNVNLLEIFKQRSHADVQIDPRAQARAFRLFQVQGNSVDLTFASLFDLMLQDGDLVGVIDGNTLGILPRKVIAKGKIAGRGDQPAAAADASGGDTSLQSQGTVGELNQIADDDAAKRSVRAKAVFTLFAKYLRPPQDSHAAKLAVGKVRWLQQAQIAAVDTSKEMVLITTPLGSSVFLLSLFPDSSGRSNWMIYVRLSGDGRRADEAAAFLRGDDVHGDCRLVEFSLCFLDGGIERFDERGLEVVPPRYPSGP